MQKDQQKKLDRMLRRQKLVTIIRIGALLVPILLGLLWWFDPPVPSATTSGTLVGLRQVQSINPGPPLFAVEIESGITVMAGGTKTLSFKPGRKVVFQVNEGMVFGSRSYRVLRYADE